MRKQSTDPAEVVAWLRGFFDGEGCVSLTEHTLDFANTDDALIAEAKRCLGLLGIGYAIYLSRVAEDRVKPIWHIRVLREADVTRFIRIVGSTSPAKRTRMVTVLRWFRRPNRKRSRWDVDSAPSPAVIAQLRQEGRTNAELRKYFGISSIGIYIKRYGLARPVTGPAVPPEPEEVRRAYWDEGLTVEEVGRRFGYRGVTIYGFMKRNNIPRRPPICIKGQAVSRIGSKSTS